MGRFTSGKVGRWEGARCARWVAERSEVPRLRDRVCGRSRTPVVFVGGARDASGRGPRRGIFNPVEVRRDCAWRARNGALGPFEQFRRRDIPRGRVPIVSVGLRGGIEVELHGAEERRAIQPNLVARGRCVRRSQHCYPAQRNERSLPGPSVPILKGLLGNPLAQIPTGIFDRDPAFFGQRAVSFIDCRQHRRGFCYQARVEPVGHPALLLWGKLGDGSLNFGNGALERKDG